MSAGEPGWYQDPGGQPGLRHWDGTRWGDEVRPHGPVAADPPRFDTSPASLYQPYQAQQTHQTHQTQQPRSSPGRSGPSIMVWVVLGLAAVALVGGIVVISGDHHHSPASAGGINRSPTTDSSAGPTVAPGDSTYTDTGSLYAMATGTNWKVGTPGFAGTATWTVTVDPTTTGKVQVVPFREDAPQPPAQLALSKAEELDPLGTRQDAGALYLVDGTGTDQLSDGSPAGIIHLHTNPLDPANAGADLVGDALVTSKATTGAMVILLCPAQSAPACLNALLPYARTVRMTSS